MVKQGQIVEVPFTLPNGSVQHHPAMVLSDIIEDELGDFFYAVLISTKNYNPQYTLEITPEMVTKPFNNKSYFVTHLLDKFKESQITTNKNTFIKPEYIDIVLTKIINNIFNISIEFG